MQKEELKSILEYHDDLYYNKDAPEITDAEYDALKAQYGEYASVPGDTSPSLKRVKHTHPITSLSKVNSLEDLRKEMERLAPFVIQPKLDGLTVVGYPGTTMSKGKLVTRGNGEYGEDITATAIKIDGLDRISKDFTIPTRMEAFMRKSVFSELNKERVAKGEEPFKNPRNAAAGMLRNKNADKVKGISYMAYNIIGSHLSESNQLKVLTVSGFDIVENFKKPDGTIVYDIEDIDLAISQIENFDRESLDYEIDGLVIKSNLENAMEVFGSTGHHPKSMVAYKFPSEGKWTTLKDVVWQTGRTGKVSPVAIIEPVDIMGSTITRVTLHNYGIMKALKLSKGCEVFVIKANDVIPAIIKSDKYNPLNSLPNVSKCPECLGEVEEIKDQSFCMNPDCEAKLLFRTCHLAKRDALDIEGLSEETIKKMIEAELIEHPFDIFSIEKEQIQELPGFANKSSLKLYNNIQKARRTSLKQFLYAAGLPLVGRTVSEDISKRLGSLDTILKDIEEECKEISQIEGIGETIIKSLKDHKRLFRMLFDYVTPDSVEISRSVSPEKQFTIVITGTLPKPRKYYEDLIKERGHKVSGSVSKKTDYLLAGDAAGSKLDKAKELGVRILELEEDLLKILV